MMAYAFIIAWLLPLAGFVLLVFRGRRIGEPRSGYLAAGLMIAAAAISLACAIRWVIGHPDSLDVSVPGFASARRPSASACTSTA